MVPNVLIFDFLQKQNEKPFRWGWSDCCLFAADYVLAVRGHDPAAQYRGTYNDETGATTILQRLGGLNKILDLSGWSRVHRNEVQTGDLGAVGYSLPHKNKPVIVPAISVGGGWYQKNANGGVSFSRIGKVYKVWRASQCRNLYQ